MLFEEAATNVLVEYFRKAVGQVPQAILKDVRFRCLIDGHLEQVDEPLQ